MRAGEKRSVWASRALIVLPLVALGVLHVCTLARNHNEAEDADYYMLNVTNNYDLFNPNHLLFSAVNRLNYDIWTALGYASNAVVPMQVLSTVAGLISLYLVYRLAIRIGVSTPLAFAATGWTAFAFGFWVYSVEGDTYILPLPFVLASAFLLVAVGKAGIELTRSTVLKVVTLGLLTAAAALLHQQYTFLIVIMAFTFFLMWRRQTADKRSWTTLFTPIAVYVAVAVAVIAAGYFAVGVFHNRFHSASETIGWARGLAKGGLWEAFSLKTPVAAVAGISRSIVSINFVFHDDASSKVFTKAFAGRDLTEERYLALHGISDASFAAIGIATLVALGAIVWLIVRAVRGPGGVSRGPGVSFDDNPARWIVMRFGAVYLVVNAIVVVIWEPDNPEFWIALTPMFAILLAALINSRERVLVPSFVLVVALFVANFLGAIWPYAHSATDVWEVRNERIFAQVVQRGDLVVTADCPYICLGNLGLTTQVRPLDATSDYGASAVEERLASPSKGRLLVTSAALRATSSSEHGGRSRIETILAGVDDRLVMLSGSGGEVVYLVASGDVPAHASRCCSPDSVSANEASERERHPVMPR